MPRCPTRLPSVVPVGVRSSRALAFLASRWPSGHLTPCVDKNNPNSWISMDFFSSIAYICRSKWCFYDFTVRTRNVSNYQMAAIPKILASKVNKVGKSTTRRFVEVCLGMWPKGSWRLWFHCGTVPWRTLCEWVTTCYNHKCQNGPMDSAHCFCWCSGHKDGKQVKTCESMKSRNMMWSCWSGWNMSHHIFLTSFLSRAC